MADVQYLRQLLESQRDETRKFLAVLRRGVASVSEAREGSNVDDEHDPEGATIAFELSQASSHLQESSRRLADIEAALARIDDGGYGHCAVCGEAIPEGRLEARPWTPFCIDHAAGRTV